VDGIFSGGTLRDEAALIWGSDPRFNAVDYGVDEYTRGRAHPMIDNAVRIDAIRRARGLVYLDVVLGYLHLAFLLLLAGLFLFVVFVWDSAKLVTP